MSESSPGSTDSAPTSMDAASRSPMETAPDSRHLENCTKQPSTPVANDARATKSSPRRSATMSQRGSVVSRYLTTTRSSPASKAESSRIRERTQPKDDPKAKEELRELIRKYLALDELSDEAVLLAQKVHRRLLEISHCIRSDCNDALSVLRFTRCLVTTSVQCQRRYRSSRRIQCTRRTPSCSCPSSSTE